MILSALCGLADAYDLIESLPEKLKLPDGKIEIQELNKNGIVCKHVKIIDTNDNSSKHTHTHSHNHGHSHHHGHAHHHGHHDHMHLSDYIKLGFSKITSIFHHHHQELELTSHRGLKEINEIIENGEITNGAKLIAKEIFHIIGLSESTIHNIPIESIHFHEVSGVDSILDIVGCAVLLDQLNIGKTYCDTICTGYGKVKTQHGILPVPAPATYDIIKNMPFTKGDEKGEKLTPTGAAIIKYLNPSFQVPVLRRVKSAYGPGQKNFINPNVVRISIVEHSSDSSIQSSNLGEMTMIEFNLDDSSAEFIGIDFQNELLQKGATDFYYTATQMKKGRPGLKVSVIANNTSVDELADFILEQTTTIGLRYYPVNRKVLDRKQFQLQTKYGPVTVKEVTTPSGSKRHKIEYESLHDIRKNHDINIVLLKSELYELIRKREGGQISD